MSNRSSAGKVRRTCQFIEGHKRQYNEGGVEALQSAPRGRPEHAVTEPLVQAVQALLQETPRALGYLRSTWSSELLSQALRMRHALSVHASTLRRFLRDWSGIADPDSRGASFRTRSRTRTATSPVQFNTPPPLVPAI